MAVTEEKMQDVLEALVTRCTKELKDENSPPAWGNITAALVKHYNVPLGEKGAKALDNLEAEKARQMRKERRNKRFNSNQNVVHIHGDMENAG
jgi:hypothetical protein